MSQFSPSSRVTKLTDKGVVRRMRVLVHLFLLFSGVITISAASAAIGDDFSRVRGDQSPGLSYSSFIATSSGRWIAAGRGGRLMISDDSGSTWRYDVIVDDSEKPLSGNVTDLIQIGDSIVGTAISVTPSSNRFGIPFEGFTQIVSSTDNGNTWQVSPFPVREAIASLQFLLPERTLSCE